MSITIPYTLIEGAMALPRLRPLSQLPASFGREWAMLPSNISMRQELRALYAAVLRTFCLNIEGMRSLCRWNPRREAGAATGAAADVAADTAAAALPATGAAAVSVEAQTAADAIQATGAHAAPAAVAAQNIEQAGQKTEATPFEAVRLPPSPNGQRDTVSSINKLAGGACVVGGAAAVLAWLALGHTASRPTVTASIAANSVSASNGAPSTSAGFTPNATSAGTRAAVTPGKPARDTESGIVANARSPSRLAAAKQSSALAPRITAPDAVASMPFATPRSTTSPRSTVKDPAKSIASETRIATERGASRHRNKLRHTDRLARADVRRDALQSGARHYSGRDGGTSAGADDRSYALARHGMSVSNALRGVTSPAAALRPTPQPSAAGTYSPLAPSMLGKDEYASVTLSASTHLRGIGSLHGSTQGSTQNTVPATNTNGVDWMTHLSQRRVTDVPDQFTR